jgi:putative ABC transport system permease protein
MVKNDIDNDADARTWLDDKLRSNRSVKTLGYNDEVIDTYRTMLRSVDLIVVVLVVSAAALAFIVLYNLTNINITERLREIATIKVLGFFRRETSAYVLRENVALTAAGIAVGLVLGIFLHRFVMAQIVGSDIPYVCTPDRNSARLRRQFIEFIQQENNG